MKIGYLGPKGSFTYLATKRHFGTEKLFPYPSLARLIAAWKNQEIDYAVVPVENSIEGSVSLTIDLIHQVKVTIQAELILPIQQQLMVHPNNKQMWEKTRLICSHPQALAQTQLFLQEHFPEAEIEQTPSTAIGAQKVAAHPTKPYAAVGSKEVAKELGLVVVQENIQLLENNETRFWVLGERTLSLDFPYQAKKATVLVDLPKNQAGELHQMLALFAKADINLTKIESRPQKTELGEYFFILDLEALHKEETIQNVLLTLDQQHFPTTFVGLYPVWRV